MSALPPAAGAPGAGNEGEGHQSFDESKHWEKDGVNQKHVTSFIFVTSCRSGLKTLAVEWLKYPIRGGSNSNYSILDVLDVEMKDFTVLYKVSI